VSFDTQLYLVTLILGCGYALIRGGRPERLGAAIVLSGMIGSNLAGLYAGHVLLATNALIVLVDLLELVALLLLACRSDRFWPMWAAMFQLDTVLTHVVMIAHSTPPFSYGLALRLFALPLPLIVGVGAWRHRRRSTR
jgi:hypothetical protein